MKKKSKLKLRLKSRMKRAQLFLRKISNRLLLVIHRKLRINQTKKIIKVKIIMEILSRMKVANKVKLMDRKMKMIAK
jgi:hypothetical protein